MSFDGFVNGDGESDISLPIITTEASSSSEAGSYPITLSGGEAVNYELTLLDGELTIEELIISINSQQLGLSIYPNPVNDVLSISYPNLQDIERIELFDLRGVLVKSLNPNQPSHSVRDLPTGVYILTILVTGELGNQRIINLNNNMV